MARTRRRIVQLLGFAALCTALAAPAPAQTYPARNVHMISPFEPGGGSDLHARALAQELGKLWKLPLVPENMGGAGGGIAAAAAARAKPDGYTIFFSTHPILVVNPSLYEKLNYDPDKDFIPVVKLGDTALMAVVNSNLGINSVADLIKAAKARPGTINFGSGGIGTTQHLSGELFKAMANIDIVHVPFKSGAPATQALFAGEVQMQFDSVFPAMGSVKTGKVRGIGVTGPQRDPAVPDMPTIGETVKGYESVLGYGILVPTGTPPAIVAQLNRDLNKVIADPAYRKEMASRGLNLDGGTPEEFKAWLGVERTKWSALLKRINVRID